MYLIAVLKFIRHWIGMSKVINVTSKDKIKTAPKIAWIMYSFIGSKIQAYVLNINHWFEYLLESAILACRRCVVNRTIKRESWDYSCRFMVVKSKLCEGSTDGEDFSKYREVLEGLHNRDTIWKRYQSVFGIIFTLSYNEAFVCVLHRCATC